VRVPRYCGLHICSEARGPAIQIPLNLIEFFLSFVCNIEENRSLGHEGDTALMTMKRGEVKRGGWEIGLDRV
jgi:hypothetical protein